MQTHTAKKTVSAAALIALITACGSTGTEVRSVSHTRRALSAEEFAAQVELEAKRVEVRIRPGTDIVEEIEIYGPTSYDEEYIQSPVVGLTRDETSMEVVLALANLVVTIPTSTARLRTSDDSHAAVADFAAEMEGGNVRLRRAAHVPPQPPHDESFRVTEARIEDDQRQAIELNVSTANFSGPQRQPDAVTVLGVTFSIDSATEFYSSDGTEMESSSDDISDAGMEVTSEFAAEVIYAQPATGRLGLADGTEIAVDADTKIDPEGDLFSVADGFLVVAEGREHSNGGVAASIRLESNR